MVTRTLICEAISQKRIVRFRYSDGRVRIVEPHVLGENSAHHDSLLGWLVGGEALDRRQQSGWRTYLLSEMQSAEILEQAFERARAGYNPQNSQMIHVYCSIPHLELVS